MIEATGYRTRKLARPQKVATTARHSYHRMKKRMPLTMRYVANGKRNQFFIRRFGFRVWEEKLSVLTKRCPTRRAATAVLSCCFINFKPQTERLLPADNQRLDVVDDTKEICEISWLGGRLETAMHRSLLAVSSISNFRLNACVPANNQRLDVLDDTKETCEISWLAWSVG